ncbi:MAG: type IV pilus modification protein PilV [Delftia acidovorans]|jgi:type IV pilus assembly protein PilV|nr:type IV pilus modification protein PilV [Delftia acidovorans]
MRLTSTHARRAKGFTLVETLVATVVTALGVLGILSLQMRTLADTQSGVRRAQAIRLIEDFSERTRANPNSLGQMGHYESDWDHTPESTADCSASACDPDMLASYNLALWKSSVPQLLPGGTAKVFPATDSDSNGRHLGIVISWRENEKSSKDDYKKPIGLHSGGIHGGEAMACPTGRTCHLQYIALSARCAPYLANNAVQFFCASP